MFDSTNPMAWGERERETWAKNTLPEKGKPVDLRGRAGALLSGTRRKPLIPLSAALVNLGTLGATAEKDANSRKKEASKFQNAPQEQRRRHSERSGAV